MTYQFKELFSPLRIGAITVKNRFSAAPMGGFVSYASKGEFSQDGIEYYVERAKGGFGLIFTGALFPDYTVDVDPPLGCESMLKNPELFKRSALFLNERLRAYDAKMFVQLSLGVGRIAPNSYAPSELPVFWAPRRKSPVISIDQIKSKIESLVNAARLMQISGFAGVEIHALHWGYLLDQFAMAITNQRTDEYGGSLENRLRPAKEIVEGIKQVCGTGFPVSMRLGVKGFMKGFNSASLLGDEERGRTSAEGIEIAKMIETFGYDLLSVDIGNYDAMYHGCAPSYIPKGYTLMYSEAVKQVVSIPVIVAGRMDDPYLCEQAIRSGKTDGVAIARASLADPYYPRKVQSNEMEKIKPCIACNQGCMGRMFSTGASAGCAVNPMAFREFTYNLTPALTPKNIAVIGAGIAGMEFARTATIRGHKVSIFEKTKAAGGHLNAVAAHPFKSEVAALNKWYQRELKELNLPIQYETSVDMEFIKSLEIDAVVFATGSELIAPEIKGINSPITVSCLDALYNKQEIGDNIIIAGGGLVGCEMALDYAQKGKQVTIIEMQSKLHHSGEPTPKMNAQMLDDLFAFYEVNVKTGHKLIEITADGVIVSHEEQDIYIAADTVIIALGFRSRPTCEAELYGTGIDIYKIGDANRVGNIMQAIGEAYEIARGI